MGSACEVAPPFSFFRRLPRGPCTALGATSRPPPRNPVPGPPGVQKLTHRTPARARAVTRRRARASPSSSRTSRPTAWTSSSSCSPTTQTTGSGAHSSPSAPPSVPLRPQLKPRAHAVHQRSVPPACRNAAPERSARQALRHPYFRELREADKRQKALMNPEYSASLSAQPSTASAGHAMAVNLAAMQQQQHQQQQQQQLEDSGKASLARHIQVRARACLSQRGSLPHHTRSSLAALIARSVEWCCSRRARRP